MGCNELDSIFKCAKTADNIIRGFKEYAIRVSNITDIGLNKFRLSHKNIFDRIGGLSIKTHRLLAHEIVNSGEVNMNEIKLLISDENIDSNIRMEILLALYNKGIEISDEILNSIQSELVSIERRDDGVIIINSKIYGDLLIFKNKNTIKGFIKSIVKDPDLEGGFIYIFIGDIRYNSDGKKLENKRTT
ncbi:MAG: hypothetical protein PHI37_05075 [Candidatus Gracilibacteria bacterium]|nr:hypothetical protein [Candidatus Gracilibacteria bacterium]